MDAKKKSLFKNNFNKIAKFLLKLATLIFSKNIKLNLCQQELLILKIKYMIFLVSNEPFVTNHKSYIFFFW